MKVEDFVKLKRHIPCLNKVVMIVYLLFVIFGWALFLLVTTVPVFVWALFDLKGAAEFSDRINLALEAQDERIGAAAMRLSRPKNDTTDKEEPK